MTDSYLRAFPTQLERKGRSLVGRLVPYDTAADVLDLEGPDGKPDLYREGFRRGAFARQVQAEAKNARTRIGLVHRHEGGLGYLGPFVGLREADDGLWGEATVLPGKADDVAALLEAGVDELSVEFRLPGAEATHTQVDASGVRWRVAAHLDAVALEPKGAYASARVLQYRAEQDELLAEQAKAEEERLAAEAAASSEAARLEAAAAEAQRKRAEWDALVGRVDQVAAAQQEYLRTYGLTEPAGYRRRL